MDKVTIGISLAEQETYGNTFRDARNLSILCDIAGILECDLECS